MRHEDARILGRRAAILAPVLADLPPHIARGVRLAFVPAEVRALIAQLPARLLLRVRIGETPSPTLLQLLKASTLGGSLELASIELSEPTFVALEHEGRTRIVSDGELARGLTHVLRVVLAELLSPDSFVTALESFATRAAKLAALRDLTAHMLRAEDVDQALYAMLSGVTSGHGLAFHRVALFQFDETRGFVGSKAIGPADEQEAHRIWEEIEYDDKGIDSLLSDYAKRNVDSRFEQEVQSIALSIGGAERDELQRALDVPGPHRFSAAALSNHSLRALGPKGDFVLAAIRPHGKVRGVFFADDRYSGAPIDDDRVVVFGGFLDQMALVWENLTLLRRVEQLARYDALTGVFARRAFEERFGEEQARASRTKGTVGILVIDVDHFKEINDARGHAAGDAVLRTLGALLKRDLRTHDVVGRIGGDEFVVLLPSATIDECTTVACRIGASARANGISLSVGGACFPDNCASAESLLAVADANLYEAKRAGRGRVSFGGNRTSVFE
jgi:diguanylate cyclase (GGDEF)-like protein